MLNISGFRLIQSADVRDVYTVSDGTVDYHETVKYKIDKISKLDPTVHIRRYPYHVDELTCTALISPGEYNDLVEFLQRTNLYIEFDMYDTTKQLPVICDEFPEMNNINRKIAGSYKFKLVSRYTELNEFDFGRGIICVPDGHEIAL